jgi:hypothetical protein
MKRALSVKAEAPAADVEATVAEAAVVDAAVTAVEVVAVDAEDAGAAVTVVAAEAAAIANSNRWNCWSYNGRAMYARPFLFS